MSWNLLTKTIDAPLMSRKPRRKLGMSKAYFYKKMIFPLDITNIIHIMVVMLMKRG